ncbi:MAG: DUF3313 domain-containing protein [Planctomycetes bacterium]|nr:DUF3313 domain-containing protein [Planctomycetota bacterium]
MMSGWTELANARWMATACTVLLAAVIPLQMLGCSTKPPRYSGFLGDYSNLKPDPQESSILYWEKPNVDWKRYTRLMIDPAAVYWHPEAKGTDIDPAELKALADYFRTTVVDAVKDRYPVVEQPGPDVLRIRAAITDVIPAGRAVNVAVSAAVLFPMAVDVGGASMEVMFLDSVTNDRLATAVDSRRGSWWKPKDQWWRGYTKHGHTKSAFEQWAKLLRESLDEVHPTPK